MPEQPKRPVGGAYGVFMNENRAEFMKQCAGQRASAVAKIGGEAWKKLTDAQKAPYEKKYIEVKAKFDKDMAAFLAAGGEVQKGAAALRAQKRKEKGSGKTKKKKDPNAPKKPVGGAYGVFLSENREMITKSLPAGHRITDVAKAASEQWKKLSAAEKKPYEVKLEKKAAEYKKAMEEYKKKHPEDVEDDEEEGEDDEEEQAEEASPPKKKGRTAT